MRATWRTWWRSGAIGILAVLLAAVIPAGAMPGFKTSNAPMVKVVAPGWAAEPILSVGDVVGDYQMAGIPDGLGAYDNGDGTFTLFMNHELSRSGGNLSDARVSKLVIEKATLSVRSAEYIIKGTEGYSRFCAATMVGPKEGFSGHYFLTNEEATDSKYGGISLAIDTRTGRWIDLPWLGKMAHENTIVAPGFPGKMVAFTTEDAAPGGVYMYVANSQADLFSGNGQLYVLGIDGAKSEADLVKGKSYSGKFAPISQADNTDNKALHAAVDKAGGVVFARPEDIIYDPADPTTIYFDTTGRVGFKGPASKDINGAGRVYKLKLDPTDPTRIVSLQVLLDGDAGDGLASPDNLGIAGDTLMIQEDLTAEFRTRYGRLYSYNLKTGAMTTILELNHVDAKGQPVPGDKPGTWETSGIIDMSAILGPGTWLFDVQAELKVPQFGGMDNSGQLLFLRSGTPAPPATGSGGNLPGLPNTGGGALADDLPVNWLVLPVLLVLATAAVALRRRETGR